MSDDGPGIGWRTPAAPAGAEIREKGSRFLARVAPAASEEEAREVLAVLAEEHRDATHHCWAWRLGPGRREDGGREEGSRERSSDAGEPSGTAGAPILAILRGAGLTDVVAVVVRWFGGTKLGKGGLARAYAAATREAVAGLRLAVQERTERLEIEVSWERLGAVKRLVHPPRVEIDDESYGPGGVRLTLVVGEEAREETLAALADLGLRPPAGTDGR